MTHAGCHLIVLSSPLSDAPASSPTTRSPVTTLTSRDASQLWIFRLASGSILGQSEGDSATIVSSFLLPYRSAICEAPDGTGTCLPQATANSLVRLRSQIKRRPLGPPHLGAHLDCARPATNDADALGFFDGRRRSPDFLHASLHSCLYVASRLQRTAHRRWDVRCKSKVTRVK